jgi:hypothetical protein
MTRPEDAWNDEPHPDSGSRDRESRAPRSRGRMKAARITMDVVVADLSRDARSEKTKE